MNGVLLAKRQSRKAKLSCTMIGRPSVTESKQQRSPRFPLVLDPRLKRKSQLVQHVAILEREIGGIEVETADHQPLDGEATLHAHLNGRVSIAMSHLRIAATARLIATEAVPGIDVLETMRSLGSALSPGIEAGDAIDLGLGLGLETEIGRLEVEAEVEAIVVVIGIGEADLGIGIGIGTGRGRERRREIVVGIGVEVGIGTVTVIVSVREIGRGVDRGIVGDIQDVIELDENMTKSTISWSLCYGAQEGVKMSVVM